MFTGCPPGINGFQWVQIADIGVKLTSCSISYDSQTVYDSSSNSNGNTYFRIKARNGSTGEVRIQTSSPAKVIDNIAPLMVFRFTASSSRPDVRMESKRSNILDLLNYVLYRSTSPTIDP
ncbi:MAG: hypothetical protein IPL16_07375 [Ignavibacteria bacterium]|nr:hypothetical protein [Ignavibacteria bacterium]